jgi:DNA-binding GntR family transcriptional regulator
VITLDHDSPVDLHEQLSNLLREQTKSGQLPGRIPSIKSLAQEYEVSTETVERSLSTLKDAGSIIARS